MTKFGRQLLNFVSGFLLGGATWICWSLLINHRFVIAQISSSASEAPQFGFWQSVFLGAVQGLTEFLPISSTAHLKAVPVALGWGDPGVTFTAIIQLGSIAAVIWYFWGDLSKLLVGSWRAIQKQDLQAQELRIFASILIGTVPIVICGLALKAVYAEPGSLDNSWLRSMTTIALASIGMSLLLALSEFVGKHRRGYEQLAGYDAIVMGCAQCLALIPGVSRSGSTLTAGLFANLERSTAARFSFLMGIPAITLAGLVELQDLLQSGLNQSQVMPVVVGGLSSALFSYLAIAWLIKFLQQRKTWVFVWYRLIFGILILVGIQFGRF
ncbi:MAG: undecaprenyl-diphosphate phosphatase [Cyanobacteria bacterium P01_H01_bin.15]